jgi:hypothetical protein
VAAAETETQELLGTESQTPEAAVEAVVLQTLATAVALVVLG